MNKNIYVQKDIPSKMRDGTILYADIYSKDKIIKETEKCQIICANCHQIKTRIQLNWHNH